MTHFIATIQEECKNISALLNINKYDVFVAIKEDIAASAKDKNPFALNASSRIFVTLRVWNSEGQVGITNTSNLTHDGLVLAFEVALNSAQFCNTSTKYDFSPLCLDPILSSTAEIESQSTSIQELAQAAVECESAILNAHASIKSVPYNKISQVFLEHCYFNSLNAFRHQKTSFSHCYFYPLAQEENKIPRQLGHNSIANNFKTLSYLQCAQTAIEKTKNHLNYEKVTTGKYMVVFSPEAFLDLVGAFSNFFNAQNILDKKSLSTTDTMNTQLSSDFLNIMDSPLHEAHIGKSFFDEEGTPTRELSILENGVLKNFIHTSYTAQVFGTKPTGHTALGSKLTAHVHFLRIFANKDSQNQQEPNKNSTHIYIENVKALHAGINALQGSFSLPFDGFIVNGEKRTSIESATIAGDFLTLLKNIIYVSPLEKVTSSGICTDIWVNDLSVTGG
ncbi:MAG: TldD/PmbA family protein [Bdellovibrionota bacterium]